MDVVHSQADLHELEHYGVLGQRLPGLGPDEFFQVPILHAARPLSLLTGVWRSLCIVMGEERCMLTSHSSMTIFTFVPCSAKHS